jgi:hypothetical protein
VPPPHPRKRKLLLFAASALALFVLLTLIAVLSLRTSSLEPEITQLRAAGHPVTIEDLNTWYPAVPAASNAALGVIAASEVLNKNQSQLQLPKRGEPITAETLRAIRTYVSDNTAALQTLHTALQLPESRYPLTLTSNALNAGVLSAHITSVKVLAQLLHYQTVHLVSETNGQAAFTPIRDGFALAATLRNEPMLISELVRIACAAIALRSLECALPTRQLTEPQLREISDWLTRTEADCSRSFQRAIIGERPFGLVYFDSQFLGTAPRPSLAPGSNTRVVWDNVTISLYRSLGFRDRDLRLYLEMMNRFSTAITNSFPAAYQQSLALESELTNRFNTGLGRFAFLTRAILPAVIKSAGKEAALITSVRSAQTAVAIERFRLAHNGTLPQNLQQLIPTYLPELPHDAAIGKPLLLEKLPSGYQITSPAAANILENKTSTVFPVIPWKFRSD